ncbi:sugar-binding transcriptional regulator [Brachybacterium sacelli]|uniref:DNA-binding transcriptional regulator LsrR (DeoR family) n=1 Tax=Brachybacterium sacelli TaxID=173364 RepID=A0ABS4WW61_9MICO|nr:sugar-binding domain-containing protein [Brachybacterium sacelli]MBP2380450.1 DNA-binding transcriptional regulator LsrR (DeoR family) [Brachybacterium sacelli]
MTPGSRSDDLFEAARMYYAEGRTMEAIAGGLDVSRSTVSRMLRDAREAGLVQITLRPPDAHRVEELRRRIAHKYGVRARVVPTRAGDGEHERLQAVADAGADLLDEMLEPGMTLGIAWGTTIATLLGSVQARPIPGLRIVQLNGAINTEGTGLTYVSTVLARAAMLWDATVHHFPVPAFFDYAATREAMWRERSVQKVLETQRQTTLAVFSVGAFDAEVPSHVYTNNYLTREDLTSLRADSAVGDVCTVFLRADGSFRDISMNARGSGTDPSRLSRIAHRLLVVSGSRKALPLRAALRAGVATDVVVDELTAASLLSLR